MKTHTNVRHYTCMLLNKIDEGILDAKTVVEAFTSYCSEDDVHDMMRINEMIGDMCSRCEDIAELNDAGLCNDCYEETRVEYCESCEEEADSAELAFNNGLCDNCMDAELEREERAGLE